ncbi:MAG: alpha/beta hydrolase [Dysgonomonas sp.]
MKKLYLFLIFSVITFTYMNGQTVIKLWEGNPPTSNDVAGGEVVDGARISNVSQPDLTVYFPEESVSKKIAVIICPGGGYARLASQHEGHQFAEWLKSQGYTGIVLKYRLPNKHKEVPLEDFQQAIKIVRAKSKEWNIDKVGVAGFSAGGHLASTASTHFTSSETRPDFSLLFYPVITMGEYTHQGSKLNLLGDNPSADEINLYSNENRVTENTPPALLMLSDDDKSVPPQNSVGYYEALKKNDVKAAMYIFPVGGHGWGMRDTFKYHNQMLDLLKNWLDSEI